MTLKKTPLNSIHKEFGAHMVEFAGWEMPVQYAGALKEHQAVRTGVGVFDVSHMGELEIQGKEALDFVQRVTCNDISRIQDGQAQYSAFLLPSGGFIDDILVYRFDAEHFLICVNAANKDKDFQWLKEHEKGRVELADVSSAYVQLAIQGPRAEALLQSLTSTDLSGIRYYWFTQGSVRDAPALISRTGYTGEDGFEIYISPEHAEAVWRQLFEAGASFGLVPAGLAARNTLRLEVRFALYDNDIDATTTPWEAGLGWIVKLEKGDFIGRDALVRQKQEGIRRKLVGFEMVDRGIARDHYPVYLEGEAVGEVTSGSYGPSVQKGIGLTYLPSDRCQIGQPFDVEVRGKRLAAQVVKTPFYKRQ